MKIESFPKKLLAEVLEYVADYERMAGLDHLLDGEFTILEVKAALREMAGFLRQEIEEGREGKESVDLRKDARLSSRARNLLSTLSPADEKKLLLKFGFLD